MNLPEEIRHLPDDQYLSVGYVRQLLADARPAPEVVTIRQAVGLWSYSRETWRQAAAEGKIPGAWQDTEGGTWRLPVAACRRYVRARQSDGRRRGTKGPRGPRSWYRPTPHLHEDGESVVVRGPEEVGRDTDGDTRPEGPRLAG